MITYIKMKYTQWKIKKAFYNAVWGLIANQAIIIDFAKKLHEGLKDVPTNQLRDEIITKIAELIHEETN